MRTDDVSTWPAGLMDYLNTNYDKLLGYHRRQKEISADQIARMGQRGKFYVNEFLADRDAAWSDIPKILADTHLLGWHCTRLMPWEIEDVKREGLSPLWPGLVRLRIERAVREGIVPEKTGKLLIKEHVAREETRKGTIHFYLTPPNLDDEESLQTFLRWWGGEAMVLPHLYDKGPEVPNMLKTIGIPCVVEAVFPASEFQDKTPRQIIYHYLAWRGFRVSEPLLDANCISCPVPATDIKRVMEFPTPEFIALTGVDSWREPLITDGRPLARKAGGEGRKKHKGKGKSQ